MNRSFLNDTLRYLPAQVVPGLVGFLSTPVVTRLFPPEAFARYSMVMATAVFASVLTGWLPMAVVRLRPFHVERGEAEWFKGASATLMLLVSAALLVCGAAALALAAGRLTPEWRLLWWAGLALAVLRVPFDTLLSLLRSARRIVAYGAGVSWQSVAGLCAGLVLAAGCGWGVGGLPAGVALGVLTGLPLMWWLALGAARPSLDRRVGGLAAEMWSYSAPLVLTNVAAWALRLSDRYLIDAFRPGWELGVYSASYNLSDTSLMLLVTLFWMSSGPLLIQVWERRGEREAGVLLRDVTRGYLLLCVPAAAGMALLARPLVAVMTSGEYRDGAAIVPWVVAGTCLLGLQQRFQIPYLLRRRTAELGWITAACAALNILANLWVVPRYGYRGAGWTTAGAYALLTLATAIRSRRLLAWPCPWGSLARVTLAAGAMAPAVIATQRALCSCPPWLQLVAGSAAGAGSYAAAILILREVTRDELRRLCARTCPAPVGGTGSPGTETPV